MDKGAHFYKADLQVHSPRDLNWGGAGAETDDARAEFSDELIGACRAKGLDAIAITDHHDIAFFKYVKAAAQRETAADGSPLPDERRIVVFPGMELTLGVPCQAIVVFDADLPVEFLESAVAALGSVTPTPPAEPKHGPIKRLEHIKSLQDLCDAFDQREALRGRYFLMPNVGENGQFSLLRKGFAAQYKSMPCVGGYVDGSITKLGQGNLSTVEGRNKEWGSKAIGVFQTSDNRRRDFADLGKHHTWVKWSRPTAEALRQACLARHSRLSQTEPERPSTFITRLEVSNSKFLGPIALDFSAQYNALIGGRGTGKSTILEYLRWGLCDQPAADSDEDLPDFQRRRRDLVRNTLSEHKAVIQVSFLINGISHVVRRKVETNEVSLKIGDADFAAAKETDIRNLLPVHAYSQKQLSSVGVRLDELNRFIHSSISRELADIRSEREGLRAKLRSAYLDVVTHREIDAEIAKLDLERKSLGEQIERLRQSLTGISDEDRAVIAAQSRYEAEERVIDVWLAEVEQVEAALDQYEETVKSLPSMRQSTESVEKGLLDEMEGALVQFFAMFRAKIDETRAALADEDPAAPLVRFNRAADSWRGRLAAVKAEYQAAQKRSAAQQSTLTQMRQVEARSKQVETAVAEKQSAIRALGAPTETFKTLRAGWSALHLREAELVQKQCDALNTLSKGLIRASLKRGHRSEAVDARFRAALKGTKLRGDRFDRVWEWTRQSADAFAAWSSILDELEHLAATTVEDESAAKLPSTPTLEALDFNARERTAVARALTAEAWIGLLVEELGDMPEFEYRARENDYIKFTDASAGQQATALMYVLLNQAGPPLIVDQPEDDLDNKVMNEIVHEIWKAKGRRQLVFSSHNANLVVNGDAELVICCDYRVTGDQSGGKIKLEGAIDQPDVNSEIASVMEGGRDAFALRKAKYGF